MKRFLAALLCALIAGTVLAFAACSDGSSEGGRFHTIRSRRSGSRVPCRT